ncbi:hypothetical protein [Haloarcula montana]|uniref:hypothetical protein n=1 Tax=Haloarcula montana TaxID=3111776 RepID=UPI002D77835E|nr:hypothetical protein [Haloarcula sp. GH36]
MKEPASIPVFRSVSRVWHFPSGDVLLELADHRDCLLPDVDKVDIPVSGTEHIAEAVVLDTDTTVRAEKISGDLILKEIDYFGELE